MNVAARQPATEKEIFVAACRLSSPVERAQFLEEVCRSKTDLRQRIEQMLAAADSSKTSPLDRMGAMLNPTELEVDAAPLQCPLIDIENHPLIGPYKLLEQIGEGGMGVVYVAQQQTPIRRMVALKIIKPGMDSRQVVSRFEAERQALALMNHPHIAKVLDAGATASGSPYFVMELVKGIPITEFCDQHQLDLRQRLELFLKVCGAVQHAHQKGVIHRDLKPSNILVELEDVKAAPKVIDFGVAKATHQVLTERTLYTGFAQLIGTPLYMSPEQAQLNSLDVDTRSDIYSLGVLLYELLTGSTPFDRDALKQAGFDEMRRIIREVDPPRPSHRITTLAAAQLSTASGQRRVDPRKLSSTLRGELDWVVMKALEKDRSRRYESASALAADLQRYLEDEPVQACPPSLPYRLRKFARRNKVRLVISLCIAMAVVGMLMVPISWSLTKRRRTEATLHAIEDKLTAATTAMETRDLLKAEHSLEAAKATLAAGDAYLPQAAAHLATLQTELTSHKRDSEDFSRFLLLAREAQTQMGYDIALGGETTGRESLAIYAVLTSPDWRKQLDRRHLSSDQKRLVLENCYETLLALADSLVRWNNKLKDPREKENRLKSSMEMLQTAQAFHEPTRAFYWIRAQCQRNLGDQKAADLDQKQFEALPARKPLDHYLPGHTAGWNGDLDQAMRSYEAALRLQPDHYNSLFFLASRLSKEKQYDPAVRTFTGCIALRPEHYYAYLNRSEAYESLGRKEDALADLRQGLERTNSRTDKLAAYGYLEKFLARTGRVAEAVQTLDQAIEDFPDKDHFWSNRANYRAQQGDLKQAMSDVNRSLAMNPKNSTALANRAAYRAELHQDQEALDDARRAQELAKTPEEIAVSMQTLAQVLKSAGKLSEALTILDQLVAQFPENSTCWNRRAVLLLELARPAEAVCDLDKAIKLQPEGAIFWSNRGKAWAHLGDYAKAQSDLERGISLGKVDASQDQYSIALLALKNRNPTAYRSQVAQLLEAYGRDRDAKKSYWVAWSCALASQATDDYSLSIAAAKQVFAGEPGSQRSLQTLGVVLYRSGQFTEALEILTKFDSSPPTPNVSPVYTWYFLAMANHQLGHADVAAKWYDKAAAETAKLLNKEGEPLPWNRRLTLQLLQAETTALLGKAQPVESPPLSKSKNN